MEPSRGEYVEFAAEVEALTDRAHALYESIQPFKGWRSRGAPKDTPDVVTAFQPVMALVSVLEQFASGIRSGVEPMPDDQQWARLQLTAKGLRQALSIYEQRLRDTLEPHGWKLPEPKAKG
jgi:hypothetical protein